VRWIHLGATAYGDTKPPSHGFLTRSLNVFKVEIVNRFPITQERFPTWFNWSGVTLALCAQFMCLASVCLGYS
jgi:hypothetical protein